MGYNHRIDMKNEMVNDHEMGWRDALEIVVTRTGHHRFRQLCSDDNPDIEQRDGMRMLVVAEANNSSLAHASTKEDEHLRAYVAKYGCGGCGG